MNSQLATGLASALALGIVPAALGAAPATTTTDTPGQGCVPTVIPLVSPASIDPTDNAVVVAWLKSRMSDFSVHHVTELTATPSGPAWRVDTSTGTPQAQGSSCDPEMTIPPAPDEDTTLARWT